MSIDVGLAELCANNILNAFRHVAHDIVSVHVGLCTGPAGEYGDNHVSAGDNSLKLVAFDAPSGGSMDIGSSPVWTNSGTTETLTHLRGFDGADPDTDDLLFIIQLTNPQNWSDEDTYTLDTLTLTLVPIVTDDGS